MAKVGRNDPCPCKSGKKYKRCHLGREQESFAPAYYHRMSGIRFGGGSRGMSLYERNMTLIDGAIDIFSLNQGKDWKEIKRKISRDHIKELYKLVAWLWPPDTDLATLLPTPENNLRSLYLGYMRPESVLNSVVRYSLYCDQILVVNPFLNPWCIAEEYNPLVRPEDYLADTIKWLLFLLQLAPWIYERHVILVPDPGDFDYQLRRQVWTLAEERAKNFSMEDIAEDAELERYSKEDFKRMFLATPTDAMRRKLKEHYPKMTEKELDGMIEYIGRLKEEDPYFPTNPDEAGMFGLHTQQTGGNLEMGLFLAQTTGAYLYTDFGFRWKEISSVASNNARQQTWGSITRAFQELDFRFLDKVDPQFANRVRQDGRLESMRNFLRKTWTSVSADTQIGEEAISNLRDELVEEHHKAEAEWKKIDADLAKWATGGSGMGGILMAGMDWQIPALGFSIAAVGELLAARHKRSQFRSNVPMSVFVDLQRKR